MLFAYCVPRSLVVSDVHIGLGHYGFEACRADALGELFSVTFLAVYDRRLPWLDVNLSLREIIRGGLSVK